MITWFLTVKIKIDVFGNNVKKLNELLIPFVGFQIMFKLCLKMQSLKLNVLGFIS